MKTEFYKMEYEAWDEGTDLLSLEQEAAYLRLCHQMYRRRGPIPNNPVLLSRLWRCHPNRARKLLDDLIQAGKVTVSPEGLTNTRVTRELDARETGRTRKVDAGQTGGRRTQEIRRNALNSNDADQAGASTGDQALSSRGEERREEKTPHNPLASGSAAEQPALFHEDGKVTPIKRPGPTQAEIEAAFATLWAAYPARKGSNRKTSLQRFTKAVLAGHRPEKIVAGAKAYEDHLRRTGKLGTEFVKTTEVWLNKEAWLDDYEPTAPPNTKWHMV